MAAKSLLICLRSVLSPRLHTEAPFLHFCLPIHKLIFYGSVPAGNARRGTTTNIRLERIYQGQETIFDRHQARARVHVDYVGNMYFIISSIFASVRAIIKHLLLTQSRCERFNSHWVMLLDWVLAFKLMAIRAPLPGACADLHVGYSYCPTTNGWRE